MKLKEAQVVNLRNDSVKLFFSRRSWTTYNSGRPPGTSVRTSLSALFLPYPRSYLSRQLNSASFGLCGSLVLENKRISGLTSLFQPGKRCCNASVPGRQPPAGVVQSSCARLKISTLNRLTVHQTQNSVMPTILKVGGV